MIGTIQGILEWLPISSQGNLVTILTQLLGLETTEALNLSILLHIGTGLAALAYYRKKIIMITRGSDAQHRKLRTQLIITTTLTGIIGLPIFLLLSLNTNIGQTLLLLTGIALIATGLLQRKNAKHGTKNTEDLTQTETIILGIAQGLAIIPGLSRSGITTTTLLIRDYSPEAAFEISFLMSIPASLAAGLGLLLIKNIQPTQSTIISLITATIIGYITIDILLRFAKKTSFWKICIGLGGLTILAYLPNLL